MRKLVLTAMALAMTVSLVGCGGGDKPADKPMTPTTPATSPMMTPAR